MSLTDTGKKVGKAAVGVVAALVLAAWTWYDPHGLAHVIGVAASGVGYGFSAVWNHIAAFFRN